MDKDAELEQYFALWEQPFPVAAEYDHWVRRGSLLRVWVRLPNWTATKFIRSGCA